MLAVSTVRDEADVIEATLSHILAQVDRAVVIDNASTDGTGAILDGLRATYGDRLLLRYESDLAYHQGRRITDLAASVATAGEWVVPFDADELWSGLAALEDHPADVVNARPYVHVPHADDDPDDPNPCTRMGHRQRQPEPFPKVCFRWQPGAVIGEGAHRVTGAGPLELDADLDVRHFQYRTLEQVTRKVRQGAAALDAAGMPAFSGAHWRHLAAMSDDGLAVWWAEYQAQDTVFDPAPLPCPR